jgi:Putative DNA-binding HTH domain
MRSVEPMAPRPRQRPRPRGSTLKPLAHDDPRAVRPLLTVREAAASSGVAESTFRNWARGYGMQARDRRLVVGEPVVTALPVRAPAASIPFIGVAEGLVLLAFRRTGVPLQRIRPALKVLEERIGLEHALACRRLYSDGAEVLFDYAETSGDRDARELVVARSGQTVFAEVVADYLRLITFAEDGWPARLRVPTYSVASVVIDPARAFGQPPFEHGSARVVDVLDRWRAGESFGELAATSASRSRRSRTPLAPPRHRASPPDPEFFVDRSLGRYVVPDALRAPGT